jgi:hypothetical protein
MPSDRPDQKACRKDGLARRSTPGFLLVVGFKSQGRLQIGTALRWKRRRSDRKQMSGTTIFDN